jgi:hypothetical protein
LHFLCLLFHHHHVSLSFGWCVVPAQMVPEPFIGCGSNVGDKRLPCDADHTPPIGSYPRCRCCDSTPKLVIAQQLFCGSWLRSRVGSPRTCASPMPLGGIGYTIALMRAARVRTSFPCLLLDLVVPLPLHSVPLGSTQVHFATCADSFSLNNVGVDCRH